MDDGSAEGFGGVMYSGVSEGLNYLKRVASHSTKESATGRIRAIPKWAQPPIDYFEAEAKEQSKRKLIAAQEHILAAQIAIEERKRNDEIREAKKRLKEEKREAERRLLIEANRQKALTNLDDNSVWARSVRKSAERRALMNAKTKKAA